MLDIITARGNLSHVHAIGKTDLEHRRVHGFFQDITERKRTEEQFQKKLDELQRFHNVSVDRELAMIELKKEVNALLRKSGQEEKYRIVG